MKKKIEISSWPRRSHYEYFQTFDCPMFSITSPVRVDALVPVLAADGEFTQILVEYRMELSDFLKHAVPLVQAAKLAPAQANPCHRADIAVFSCLPWIPFTQVASAYRVFRGQYFPLIHWGKMEADASGRMVMPVAIQANHVLVDGVHVGRFYGILEELCGNQFC